MGKSRRTSRLISSSQYWSDEMHLPKLDPRIQRSRSYSREVVRLHIKISAFQRERHTKCERIFRKVYQAREADRVKCTCKCESTDNDESLQTCTTASDKTFARLADSASTALVDASAFPYDLWSPHHAISSNVRRDQQASVRLEDKRGTSC